MAMKRKLLTASAILVVSVVSGALFAAPRALRTRPSRGTKSALSTSGPRARIVYADLVVSGITVKEYSVPMPGQPRVGALLLNVKNVGTRTSGPCTVALCTIQDVDGPKPSYVSASGALPPIAPGASSSVKLINLAETEEMSIMFIAAVDVPVAAGPAGQVNEGPIGERNNAFGFTAKSPLPRMPFTWDNPAVK